MLLTKGRTITAVARSVPPPAAMEPMYSPQDIAAWLSVDESSVRRWFAGLPGVLRLGNGKHATIRVPLSVLQRFIEERSR